MNFKTGLFALLSSVGAFASAALTYDVKDLGTLGGTYSYSGGIGPSGQIVGHSTLSGNASYHAFLYSGGVMTDLGTLGGTDSWAMVVNS